MRKLLISVLMTLLASAWASAQFVQDGGKLIGTGRVGKANQGTSIALSADGNTAIVGGPNDNRQMGAAWVFTRSGGLWTQQGEKVVGTGAMGSANQGTSVALSADGNTAIVGGPNDNNTGAAWVFTRSGGAWTQQGEKLVGTGVVGSARQGTSVTLSADGNTAIVGGPGDNEGTGAAWVFTRSGGVWTQQGDKLVGTGAVGNTGQGTSVALSGDGSTAIVGGPGDNGGNGAAWGFTRSGGVWTQLGSRLVGTGAVGSAFQGQSVAVSADGTTAIVGGPDDNGRVGAAWVFTRSGAAWMQQGERLVGTGVVEIALQGFSIAMSADGSTAIVGGYCDDGAAGATWVFTRLGGAWTQQGEKLVGSGDGRSGQGWSVALSADGTTAIVGGPYDNGGQGAAWVFTRSGGVWTQQGDKLVGTGAVGPAGQGHSVALSADGTTAIVGGPADNGGAGAAWVFTRSGGVWMQQGEKLVGTGAGAFASQGRSVAISADGNTAIVGGPYDNDYTGAAWVFTRSGGAWTQQGDKLVGTGAVVSAMQGYSVALSADGNTAIVGGPYDNGYTGAAWVFTRSGAVWTQLGSKLVGTSAVGFALQGTSVALSADGNTVIVGGPNDDNGETGAAWVFTRSGGGWTQQGSKLVGTGAAPGGFGVRQGWSVALSADGNTAIVGGPNNFYTGSAWVFTRLSGVWTQQGERLVGTGAAPGYQFGIEQGWSVALSGDGNTAILGGPGDNHRSGAAWVFTRSGGVWMQQGDKLVGTGAVRSDLGVRQGTSVALSADGTTAIVGGPYDNDATGAAWVFIRTGKDLWVPVVAHNPGLRESQWSSDLGLLNAGPWTANVRLAFHGTGGVATNTTYVPPGTQSILVDVVGQLDVSGQGALEVFSDLPLVVTSRTYNQVSSAASCHANGTQGQDYPTLTASDGLSAGQSAYLTGLTENASYRANIGLVNTGPTAAVVTVELYDGTGTNLADYTVSLAPGQWAQETQPFRNRAGQTAMDRGYAKVTVTSGSGVAAFASVVDNITNDPTTITMANAESGQQGEALWVPVVAHNPGLQESQWRSDLGLLNTGTSTANVLLAFHGTGGVVTNTTYVPPGAQSILVDVVGQLAADGQGALAVSTDQPLVVTSRTYNQVPSTASCYPNGTQGQNVPTLTAGDGLSSNQSAWLTHLTENSAYRANIGLVNTGLDAAVVAVELYDGAATKLTDYTVNLAPGQWAQETQPFRNRAGQTAMDRGYAKVTVTSGSGVVAFASVVDNITNDPTTITMQR